MERDDIRTRILGLPYDLRHAMMGDRDTEWVDAGRQSSLMAELLTEDSGAVPIRPAFNAYNRFEILWPEVLFQVIALNGVIRRLPRKRRLDIYGSMESLEAAWDPDIAQIRFFQAAVLKALRAVTTPIVHRRMVRRIESSSQYPTDYCFQYVDHLNFEHLQRSPAKRLSSLGSIVQKLSEDSEEYLRIRGEILGYARSKGVDPEQVTLRRDYPDVYEW